ncbi:uteroglobin-like [Ornithorhynchus anatinus]|uniref:uteroglobin-like n=1 Tax=Ornithorhynchus anatinus TaxID=9258 RepID=UPI0007AA7488|nr:uteroglobin-like [Ornithorhynchus anatinus]
MKVAVIFVLLSLGLFCSVGDACPDFQNIIDDYLGYSTDVLLAKLAPYEPSDNALEAVRALKDTSDAFTVAERKSVGETLKKMNEKC